jgi:hypothetical protein
VCTSAPNAKCEQATHQSTRPSATCAYHTLPCCAGMPPCPLTLHSIDVVQHISGNSVFLGRCMSRHFTAGHHMTAASHMHSGWPAQIFVRLSHTHAPSPAPFHSEDAAHTRPPALRCTPALRHSRVTMMRFSSLAKVSCCDASCPFCPPATAAPHPQSLHSSLSHFKFHRLPSRVRLTPSARASVVVVTEQPRQSHDIAHDTVHALLYDVLSRTLGERLEPCLAHVHAPTFA